MKTGKQEGKEVISLLTFIFMSSCFPVFLLKNDGFIRAP
jgi:hypothetical protein